MLWGPPAQPSQLPEADPRREPLLGGRGVGEGDDDPQRSPTRLGHGAPPGWVCARPRHPPILQLARFASGGARP